MGKTVLISDEELQALIIGCVNTCLKYYKPELTQPESEELLTRKRTAEIFDVDESTLWHWQRKGKIKAYGIGNRVYFKRSEIEKSLIPIS